MVSKFKLSLSHLHLISLCLVYFVFFWSSKICHLFTLDQNYHCIQSILYTILPFQFVEVLLSLWLIHWLTLSWKCVCLLWKWKWSTQLCPTLWDPMYCNLLGSFFHGIFQVRVLEWVSIFFSRRSSETRDWTQISWIVCRRLSQQGSSCLL